MTDSANTGELVALALKRAGVSNLFTINGGHIWPILTAAAEHGIRIIDVRHEQSAAFAAEGWAKVTRECGVATVTAGPGVTNSISALAQAQASDSPMFLIGGRAPVARWGMGSLQEMDNVAVVQSLTKKAVTLASAEEADGLAAHPDPDTVARVANLIRSAERPAVIAGGNVWWAHAEEELRQLVEVAHLPLSVNGMARGVLPAGHPLFFPRARGPALADADLILVVGVPLDFRLNWGLPPVFAEGARLVYVDVDAHRKHRPAEAGLYGDLRAALAALAAAATGAPERPQWLAHLREADAASRARDAAMTESDSSPVHPARLIVEVDRFADPDAIYVGDGGEFISFAGRLIERPK